MTQEDFEMAVSKVMKILGGMVMPQFHPVPSSISDISSKDGGF